MALLVPINAWVGHHEPAISELPELMEVVLTGGLSGLATQPNQMEKASMLTLVYQNAF